MRRWLARRGLVRTVFEALLLVQLAHLGEHIVQIAQIHVLGWPAPQARGLVGAFDVETVHFVWNLGVLFTLGWLLRRGIRSALVVLTCIWAAAHTAEHGYLVTRAVLTGAEGAPGILGHGGVLARLGVAVPGLTTWSRPIVHLVWNTGEVALLVTAYAAFASASLRAWSRRAVPVVPGIAATTISVLALTMSATRADQPVMALAPLDVVLDGRNELVGVAVGADGTRYVSDRGAGLVYRVSSTGTLTIAAANLDRPAGLALTGDGRLLIVEEHAGRVLRLEPSGALTPVVAGLKTPRWIDVQDDGSLYVTAHRLTAPDGADPSEGRVIVRIDPATGAMSEAATGLRAAQGLAHGDGALVVASKGLLGGADSMGALLRYPMLSGGALGLPQLWIGTGLKQPVGIAIDAPQAIYIASKELTLETDTSKRAVGKAQPSGVLTDFASNFADPQGVAIGADGALYVADGKAGRLYRFRPPLAPVLDRMPPVTIVPSVAVTGASEPGARIDLFVDDAPHAASGLADAAGRFVIPLTLHPNTRNHLEVHATAHAGDGLTSSATRAEIVHDDVAPAVTLTAPPAGAHVRGAVSVSAATRDDGSGVASVELTASGQHLAATSAPAPPAPSVTAAATWQTTTVADGTHTVSAAATDVAGNVSAVVARSIIVDNTPPETIITSGPDGETTDTAVSFSFTGVDAITPAADLTYAWRMDGGVWNGFASATTVALSGLAEGPHTFEVKGRDRAGNEDASPATRAFRIMPGLALSGVSPDHGTAGTLVTVAGRGFTPDALSVAFNGVPAVVRSARSEIITTTVPIGAASGPLVVTSARGVLSAAFTVDASGDFAVDVSPAALTSLPGATVSYALAVAGRGTFTGLVSINVAGLPPDVTAEVLPAPFLAPGQRGELRLEIAPDATPGTTRFAITARGVIDGVVRSQEVSPTLTLGAAGQTAVAGRFVLTSGEPLMGVAVTLGAAHATTDAAGNFLLLDPPTGTQMMAVDANASRPGLPIYAMDVDVVAGAVTTLPPAWLTAPPPTERFVPIANASADQVVSDARFPGVAFTLPAGVTITGWDGTLKTKIALERIALDRLPVPPPPGRTRSLYQLFFGTPMGGVPSAPLPVTLPNDLGLEPGAKAQLWYYDAAPLPGVAAAWRMAGLGTVSADGRMIASDPGVGIARFCGVCGLSCFIDNEDAQPSADEGTPEDGEPVNLAMGQHLVDAVDLVQPGRVPAVVYRTYNPFDAFGRISGFELVLGQGWALSIDVALLDVNTSARRLIMPGNARYDFAREPDGGFVNRTNPRFRGATIVQEADGVQALRFASGTVWRFRGGWIGRGRIRPTTGLNLLVEQRDRHGNALTVSRDANGGPTAVTQSDGRSIVFTTSLLEPADPTSARLTAVRDALGRTVQYGYDSSSRRLTSVIDAAGGETRYTYDTSGRILTIRDQNGVTYVEDVYDAQGRVSSQRLADGGVWRYVYEGPVGAHTVVRVTDPRGHTTTHRIGASGRGDEVIDALGQSTRAQRDTTGLAGVVTDALGRSARIEYDGALRPATVVDRDANRWSFTYDASGHAQMITDPLGNVSRFEYDSAGNLTARINPEGDRLEFTYDAGSAPTSVTDALGRTTTYTYDAAGNVTTIRDPLGNTATFEHDAGSRLVTATDPTGGVTRWFHDALNRVTRVVDPNGGVSTFEYDAKGNLLSFRDQRGNATTYTYDSMDRLRTRTDALGRTRTFAYDLNGNVIRSVDAKGQATEHAYDALNRRIRTTHADGTIVEYVYDAVGRLIRVTDTEAGSLLLTYDAQDRLIAETSDQGTVRFTYDVLGRRRSLDMGAGIALTYDYDRNSRLRTLTDASWGTTTLDYLATGQLQRRTLPSGFATRYEYDDAARLTRLTYETTGGVVRGDLAYTYDGAGRRTATAGSLARTLLPDTVDLAGYDAANQQLLFGDYTLTYDANGNATSLLGRSGLATLAWDARDRLLRVTLPDTTLTFAYDPIGRRTERVIGDTIARYQYAGADVGRDSSAGVDIPYLRGLGTDETLGQERSLAYMIDGRRSTIGLADAGGGLAQTFAYEPFGRASTDGDPDRVRYQFTGRERDTDWLYYYRARYYAPRLARFLQPDPLGRAGGGNPYVYAANNPLSFVDPSGLRTYVIHGCCQSAQSAADLATFSRALEGGDPDVRTFYWSSNIFFDVFPSTKTPSRTLFDDIVRDLEARPLAPGEKLNLVGHSAGGIIANNVANTLRARGIPVDNLIMMGTPLFPGTINAAMPTDVPITNFDGRYDPLSTSKHGPNVTEVPVISAAPDGTFDALTAHTGYMENPVVVNTIKRLIRP